MNDAEKLIAEVASRHRLKYDDWAIRDADFYTCECGLKTPPGDGIHAEWWDTHLAAEIVKALGVLVRQEQWVPVEESGHRWSPRSEPDARYALEHFSATGDCHHPEESPVVRIDHEARWVSEWKPVQP